jgi:hypothetical protein
MVTVKRIIFAPGTVPLWYGPCIISTNKIKEGEKK